MNNETRRILLVEDEKAIRDAVAAYLERENYWVTAVGDGQEALEEFQKHHFDLVVLDLMLPRVPGERVCRAIRDNSDVPIIMLTAKGEEVDLTASEFKLLTTLSRYPGRVYSRMELVEKVLGYDFEGYERTIDSHVKNLRAKIGDNPRNPKWLHTVHGVGYRFEDPTKSGK